MPTRDVNDDWAGFVKRRMDRLRIAGASDLARRSGIDQSVISRWLNEGRTPRVEHLRRLVEPLKTPLLDLMVAAGHLTAGEARADAAPPADPPVVSAVQSDPNLLPEAKRHLLNQYELLLRLQAAPQALSPEAAAQTAEFDEALDKQAQALGLDKPVSNGPKRRT